MLKCVKWMEWNRTTTTMARPFRATNCRFICLDLCDFQVGAWWIAGSDFVYDDRPSGDIRKYAVVRRLRSRSLNTLCTCSSLSSSAIAASPAGISCSSAYQSKSMVSKGKRKKNSSCSRPIILKWQKNIFLYLQLSYLSLQ